MTEKGKIDVGVLADLIAQGYPKWKAAKMAGSNATNRHTLAQVAQKTLKRPSNAGYIDKIKEKEEAILTAMSDEKIGSASLAALAKAYGTLVEKRRLMEGSSTENKAIVVKWLDGEMAGIEPRELVEVE